MNCDMMIRIFSLYLCFPLGRALQFDGVDNVEVKWSLDSPRRSSYSTMDDPFIHFTVNATEIPLNTWIGVGVSLSGGMLGTRAMVASVVQMQEPSGSSQSNQSQTVNAQLIMQEYEILGFGEIRRIVAVPANESTSFASFISYTADATGPLGNLAFSFARVKNPNDARIATIYVNGSENFFMIAKGAVSSKTGLPLYHYRARNVSIVDFSMQDLPDQTVWIQ